MPKIILIGMKSCGKTTVGLMLAQLLNIEFVDMDTAIEQRHAEQHGESLPFREIFKQYGKAYFRTLETETLMQLAETLAAKNFVLATGGGLPLEPANQPILKRLGTVVFLDTVTDVLLARILPKGIPAFFPYPDNPEKSLNELLDMRRPIYLMLADLTIVCSSESAWTLATNIIKQLEALHHAD